MPHSITQSRERMEKFIKQGHQSEKLLSEVVAAKESSGATRDTASSAPKQAQLTQRSDDYTTLFYFNRYTGTGTIGQVWKDGVREDAKLKGVRFEGIVKMLYLQELHPGVPVEKSFLENVDEEVLWAARTTIEGMKHLGIKWTHHQFELVKKIPGGRDTSIVARADWAGYVEHTPETLATLELKTTVVHAGGSLAHCLQAATQAVVLEHSAKRKTVPYLAVVHFDNLTVAFYRIDVDRLYANEKAKQNLTKALRGFRGMLPTDKETIEDTPVPGNDTEPGEIVVSDEESLTEWTSIGDDETELRHAPVMKDVSTPLPTSDEEFVLATITNLVEARKEHPNARLLCLYTTHNGRINLANADVPQKMSTTLISLQDQLTEKRSLRKMIAEIPGLMNVNKAGLKRLIKREELKLLDDTRRPSNYIILE